MKFSQRFSIHKDMDLATYIRGIWNPTTSHWRDIVEDYLYISRKRLSNKLAIFKLQLHILQDILTNINGIDKYKVQQKQLEREKGEKEISEVDFNAQMESVKSEIFALELVNTALKEIVDGIAWRYLNYDRAVLYLLADKEPVSPIRVDEGFESNIHEFADAFLVPEQSAIINDITNFLRVGDVTIIKENGDIELVEVKNRKKRGSRITRQKRRMEELVELFNTGIANYDGKKLIIHTSKVRQKNYLSTLLESIKKTRTRGFHSELIGEHAILEVADFEAMSKRSAAFEEFKQYLETRHRTVKDKWKERGDIVIPFFFTEKLNYARNYVPFSIFPFDHEICTDILMGRIMVNVQINYSEIIRILDKHGWKTIDNLFTKIQESKNDVELAKLRQQSLESFLTVRKGPIAVDLAPGKLGRLHFELLSPKVIIDELEEKLSGGPREGYDFSLTNYSDGDRIWR
jgi:hypothetical protein